MIGQRVGNYRIVREIGRGGMGAVYEGLYDQLKRRAAIKLLKTEYAKSPHVLRRFFNEARAANIVAHPSIVTIFEHGYLPAGDAYIIMEYLEGVPLSERRPTQAIRPAAWLFRFMRQIASGLAAAHQRGVIHRDLKPDNVMIISDPETLGGERVKILDFGIAKLALTDGSDDSDVLAGGGNDLRTRPGSFMGTPRYLSPEQCRDPSQVTDKTDVYALGVIMYEFLASRPPFRGHSAMDVIAKHLNEQAEPINDINPDINETICNLVMSMLDKNPERRPSMIQAARILTSFESVSSQWEPTAHRLEPEREGSADEKSPAVVPSLNPIDASSIGDIETRLPSPSKRRLRFALAGSLLMTAIILIITGRSLTQILIKKPDTVPPKAATSSIKELPSQKKEPSSNIATRSSEKVKIRIESIPDGAAVIRHSDGIILGYTPWNYEHTRSSEELNIILHRDGFLKKMLALNLERDDIKHETLEPQLIHSSSEIQPPPSKEALKLKRRASAGPPTAAKASSTLPQQTLPQQILPQQNHASPPKDSPLLPIEPPAVPKLTPEERRKRLVVD